MNGDLRALKVIAESRDRAYRRRPPALTSWPLSYKRSRQIIFLFHSRIAEAKASRRHLFSPAINIMKIVTSDAWRLEGSRWYIATLAPLQ